MKTELIIYDLDEMTELISAVKSYDNNSDIDSTITKDINVVSELISKNKKAILIFPIKTKDQFGLLINIFKSNIKELKNGQVKIAYFQQKKNQKVENILRKFNCKDFLDSEMSVKSLSYKIDIWEKSVVANIKKEELKKVSLSSSSSSKRVLKDHSKRSHKVNVIEAIADEFDIWIAQTNNSKNVLSKWLVSYKGPSPHVSSWELVESGLFKFVIEQASRDQFYKTSGSWYFKGLKPEFNWKEKIWSFSSNDFNLYFKDDKDNITSRAFSKGLDLLVRENSKVANLKAETISRSADSKVSLDSEKQELDESKKSLKGSKTKKEFMEAESKTDKLNSNMVGDAKPEAAIAGHFKGKFKESSIKESSNYSLKNKNKNKKEGRLSGVIDNNKKELSKKEASSEKTLGPREEKNSTQTKNGPLKEKGHTSYEDKKDEIELNQTNKENTVGHNEDSESSSKNNAHKDNKSSKKKSPLVAASSDENKSSEDHKNATNELKTKELSRSGQNNKDKPIKAPLDFANAREKANQKEAKNQTNKEDQKTASLMEKAMVNPATNAVRISAESIFYLCDLVDLFEQELYVTVKESEIDKSINYNIVLSMDMGAQKATITTEGKVESVEDGIYKFSISKIPQADYDKFMSHFELKQDEINDFLVAARGF